MRPIRFAILPALCGSVLFTGLLHNHLVESDPAAGAKVAQSPKEIRLWFAERPEVAFTSATLIKGDSTRIATIPAVATNDSMAAAIPLTSPLPPGDYLVGWRSASTEGPAARGTFGFFDFSVTDLLGPASVSVRWGYYPAAFRAIGPGPPRHLGDSGVRPVPALARVPNPARSGRAVFV